MICRIQHDKLHSRPFTYGFQLVGPFRSLQRPVEPVQSPNVNRIARSAAQEMYLGLHMRDLLRRTDTALAGLYEMCLFYMGFRLTVVSMDL